MNVAAKFSASRADAAMRELYGQIREPMAGQLYDIRDTLNTRRAANAGDRQAHRREAHSPSLKEVDLKGFMASDKQLPYAIGGLVPLQRVTLLGAHGGAGKSILALTWAAHVACGREWASRIVLSGKAIYCSLEDEPEVLLLWLRMIVQTYDLDATLVERYLLILDGTASDGALVTEKAQFGVRELAATRVLVELREKSEGAKLIVIDNASDAFDGNENERRAVRRFLRLLAQLARASGASVILLAHVDKSAARFGANENTYSGSTAWHNSARSRLALVEFEGGIKLVQEKHNLGRKAQPIPLHWNDHGVLLTGTEPLDWQANLKADRDDEDNVLAAMRAAAAAGIDVPASHDGSKTAYTTLRAFAELSPDLQQRSGRLRFWNALNRLLKVGAVNREPYLTAHRNKRTRLIVSPTAANLRCGEPPYTPAVHRTAEGGEPLQSAVNVQ
jgi:RecA-family ATPase